MVGRERMDRGAFRRGGAGQRARPREAARRSRTWGSLVRMRRWNGWGDDALETTLPSAAVARLSDELGPGVTTPDAALEAVLQSAPPSRLEHRRMTTDARTRVLHARGQSLPDWVALRSGRIGVLPDAVAFPESSEDVRELLALARDKASCVIPFGGGTSVVGHITPLVGDRPVITLSMERMGRLVTLDAQSRLATFEAGALGPDLERQLAPHGLLLGHYPQSFEYSTLGGWIASRSSGQQSYHYGRIEDLLAGVRVETPAGPLQLPPLPASAAGPDLRSLVLGSEGRLGVICEATVRVSPKPDHEAFHAALFQDFDSAVLAGRKLAQQQASVSMIRVSDAEETSVSFTLSGKREQGSVGRALGFLGYGAERSVLLFGLTGSRANTVLALKDAYSIAASSGGIPLGPALGRAWRKTRFRGPYLRNALWDAGYAADTLETAVPWSAVSSTAVAIKRALRTALTPFGERVLCFSHLSHLYRDGASIYVTFLFRRATDPDALIERWRLLKSAASRAIVEHGGTISHQHGVGLDHAPYLHAEKTTLGLRTLAAAFQSVDESGMMNPGKLLPAQEA